MLIETEFKELVIDKTPASVLSVGVFICGFLMPSAKHQPVEASADFRRLNSDQISVTSNTQAFVNRGPQQIPECRYPSAGRQPIKGIY